MDFSKHKDAATARVKDLLYRLKHGGRSFQQEVRERAITYILAGLGVVTGLAWNEAISALIEYLFPLSRSGVAAKFVYAILMTLLVVLATIILMRWLKKEQD